MELDVPIALLLVATTYALVSVVGWAFRRRRRLGLLRRYGIPGPEPSFLLGNLAELKSVPANMEIVTGWLRKYGDVFGYYVGEVPTVVVKDLELIKQVMIKDFHVFSNRPKMFLDVKPLIYTVLALRDKRWKEVRSLLTPTFSSGKIKLMSHIFNRKVDVALEVVSRHAREGRTFDIYELVQGLTLDVIADCALAMKTDCQRNPQDPFLLAVRDFFRFAHNRAVEYAIMFPFVASVMTFVSNYMTAGQMTTTIVENVQHAIRARRSNPDAKSLDLLQLMLEHDEDQKSGVRMTDEEIVANAYIFLLAGYETTATALAFTFYLLVKHPDVQEKLVEEIRLAEDASYSTVQGLQYLDQVFSESMRLYPPVVSFIARDCDRDHVLGAHTIPKGATVMAPVWDIHRDPELWPDPLKFDPDRFSPENKGGIRNLSFFPFGIGPRNCIGSRFAQLEAKLTIFRLVKAFRFEACEATDDPLPLVCPTVIINPANGVHLRAVSRDSAKSGGT